MHDSNEIKVHILGQNKTNSDIKRFLCPLASSLTLLRALGTCVMCEPDPRKGRDNLLQHKDEFSLPAPVPVSP